MISSSLVVNSQKSRRASSKISDNKGVEGGECVGKNVDRRFVY
jgi:hypothetical protein